MPISNSDRFRITQTSNAVQLAIEHVQREDAGHYTLYAKTKNGDVIRKDVELVVEDRSVGDDPPIFLRRLNDLSVKVGTRTRLLVEIRSSTDVKVNSYDYVILNYLITSFRKCQLNDLQLQIFNFIFQYR